MNINPERIKNYTIVTASDEDELREKVNANIADGFYPYGGVSISQDSWQYENGRKGYTETQSDVMFAQAMVSLHDL